MSIIIIHFFYSFLLKLIVFTDSENENVCTWGLNKRASYVTEQDKTNVLKNKELFGPARVQDVVVTTLDFQAGGQVLSPGRTCTQGLKIIEVCLYTDISKW